MGMFKASMGFILMPKPASLSANFQINSINIYLELAEDVLEHTRIDTDENWFSLNIK